LTSPRRPRGAPGPPKAAPGPPKGAPGPPQEHPGSPQVGPPRPSPKPSSKAEASRQEVALPSRAVKLRSDGTCSSTNVLSNPVGGGGPRAQRVLDPPPPAKHGKRVVDPTEVRSSSFFCICRSRRDLPGGPAAPEDRRPTNYLPPSWAPKIAPRSPQEPPRSPQEASRSPQDRPKIAQDPPKIAQDGLKIAQDGPRAAQDAFGALLGPLRVSLGAS
jgi:hypothetical protein